MMKRAEKSALAKGSSLEPPNTKGCLGAERSPTPSRRGLEVERSPKTKRGGQEKEKSPKTKQELEVESSPKTHLKAKSFPKIRRDLEGKRSEVVVEKSVVEEKSSLTRREIEAPVPKRGSLKVENSPRTRRRGQEVEKSPIITRRHTMHTAVEKSKRSSLMIEKSPRAKRSSLVIEKSPRAKRSSLVIEKSPTTRSTDEKSLKSKRSSPEVEKSPLTRRGQEVDKSPKTSRGMGKDLEARPKADRASVLTMGPKEKEALYSQDGTLEQLLAAKEREDLEVFKQDLCPWLTTNLKADVTLSTFFDSLDTGVLLCKLAWLIQEAAKQKKYATVTIPVQEVQCNRRANKNSSPAYARDNASNFIEWCKKLGVKEIFESEGLVLHKDEKGVILCLLDVARFAARVGLPPPQLVQMEREIDEPQSSKQPTGFDRSLEERVKEDLERCTCRSGPLTFEYKGNGKYILRGGKIRGEKTVHTRLVNGNIVVRVGGGWDGWEHFLLKYDPCRFKTKTKT